VWCFGEAESDLSMGGFTEQMNASEICDNKAECSAALRYLL